ncbi:MAG: aspartyl protease family protein [Gemmatimonadota bacterium]|nr:MAG: aspartyl protease family protein [Gemmatimonadota bacterium]
MDRRNALALLIVLLCVCLISRRSESVGQNLPETQELISVIPFELDGHKICVNVTLNNNPEEYKFVLDTGALTMIDEEVAAELRLEKGAEMPTLDPSVKTYLTTLKKLSVGDMVVENMTIPIMDTKSFFSASSKMDGFVGSDFLRLFRLTIDYRTKTIIHYAKSSIPDSLHEGYRMPLERHIMIGAPMVACTLGKEITTKGMIDTGSPFGLVLPLSFAGHFDGPEKIRSKGVIAQWPFTSSETNYLSRLELFTLGTLELRNIPVIFAELPATVSYPLLGKEILSQFAITLNFPESELILSPHGDAHFHDNVYSTGLAVKKGEDDRIVVRGLWAGSPADRANIRVGDEILEINSQDTEDFSMEEIHEMLRDDGIHKIELVVKSEGTERDVILEKDMLLPGRND